MKTTRNLVFLALLAIAFTFDNTKVGAFCSVCDATCNPEIDCEQCGVESGAYQTCFEFCYWKGGVSNWGWTENSQLCGDGGVVWCTCG